MIGFKRVLVLYVGGTIGMQKNHDNVYVPVPKTFLAQIKKIELHDYGLAKQLQIALEYNELILPIMGTKTIVAYKIEEYEPLLDSSNMSVNEWTRIAKDIEKNYNNFDGFVVLHGTDTMAFTSSALSFMLENLNKPVIVTGSQVPIFESNSDAKDNFLSALLFAARYDIPEVCIFFANKLLRGNRATKISSDLFEAFDSPNYHCLANAEIDVVHLHERYISKIKCENPLSVHSSLTSHVGILPVFPTITSSQLESFLRPPTQGLVLQTYGAGNIPSNKTDLIRVLKQAVDRGILIINITQCPQGPVHTNYETGKVLEAIGVISGFDMTSEAAFTKLIWVASQDISYENKVELLRKNLRGELTKE